MNLPSPKRIEKIAFDLGLAPDQFEPCGWFKAKLALGLDQELSGRPLGKYVNVTAISPTPLGEGKTVTAIGAAMGLCRLGKRAIVTLREPSIGPLFGIKGGGAGGGKSHLTPLDDINLHFTGDIHAVSSATNLLAALIDNHCLRRKRPLLNPSSISWRRAVDVCDRSLSRITTRCRLGETALSRETGFDLTAASELMAILALAQNLPDLRRRLGRIYIGDTPSGDPVFAEDVQAAGAMASLLRDALRPNLVQTSEGTPALVHTGPFGNIAHGNSSVLADLAALRLAEFVITESGFGSDCGAEKFFNIKCRLSGLRPDAEVLVCSVRALKLHSGRFNVRPGRSLPPELLSENLESLNAGAENLKAHIEILRQFGIPIVVAINRFPADTPAELEALRSIAHQSGAAFVAQSDAFQLGGAGSIELAEAIMEACSRPNQFELLYPTHLSPQDKMLLLASRIYGADGIDLSETAAQNLQRFIRLGFGTLPICMAKTQYSLSHDPNLLGRPRGFRFPVQDVRLASGAGYIYALAGNIVTMPGLPSEPAALQVDVTQDGEITGLR